MSEKQSGKSSGSKRDEDIQVKIRSPKTAEGDVRKKWLIFGGIFLVLIFFSSYFMSQGNKPIIHKKKSPVVSTTPSDLDVKDWREQSAKDIKSLKDEIEQMRFSNSKLESTLSEVIQSKEELEKNILELKKEQTEQASKALEAVPPPLVPESKVPPGDQPSPVSTKLPAPTNNAIERFRPPPPPGSKRSKPAIPTIKKIKQPSTGKKAIIFNFDESSIEGEGEGGKGEAGKEAVPVKVRYKKNKNAGTLTISFIDVALLHGVDAKASVSAKEDPLPVLMRLQSNAQMPGGAKYKLKSCFVLGSAIGDLSSERVEIRSSRLNCVDNRKHLVLTADIKGYIVDSDSMLGLRGQLFRRNGALLAKSLLAGFAQGLGSAFSAAQGTVVTAGAGGANTGAVFSGSDALKASGLQGASGAMSQLASYFLKEAQAIFPVIEVGPGRKGTLVITEPVSLKWEDYGSVWIKEETPIK